MHDDDDRDRVLSLAASIAILAADSGAPDSFVEKIKALFEAKGIPLERSARPYLGALQEAFRREESLRRLCERSMEARTRARHDLGRGEGDWEGQLAHLRALQDELHVQARRLRSEVERLAVPPRTVLCPGSVELPFVPGPDTLQ
ncbi:MAG TPA: hypothetical protein VFV75_05780 [Candidatus Polarisedimenticolaceae bacterium]|nr:hypothetical protein [Candidatus Polarisedimenticolaceae bacterium]